MRALELLLKAVDQLGRANLVLAGIAAAVVVMLWTKHRDDRVDFLLSIVMTSPFIAGLLALPIMSWTKLFLYDAARAAAFGGKREMYFNTELRMMYVRGHPWVRLSDVCKILGIGQPEKLVRRMSGQECDAHDTDHDWLSEHGVKKLGGMPLGPEAAKFAAWFEREIVKPAAKRRDQGKPLGVMPDFSGPLWVDLILLAAYLAWAAGVTTMLLLARRPPMSTVAWLLALLLLPYVGALLWFFFGPRRLRRKRLRYARSRSAVADQAAARFARPENLSEDFFHRYRQLAVLAERLDQPPPARAAGYAIYADGDALYDAMLEAIAGARDHLHLEYYIWREDGAGTRLRDALAAKAREGVKVRLLVDTVGSNTTHDAFFAPLEAAGGEVAWFNRPHLKKLRFRYVNFRTHRKILVADGRTGFVGGMNVTDDHSRRANGDAAWRDTHLRVEGPPVAQLQRVFLDDWAFARGPCAIEPQWFPDPAVPAPAAGPYVQVVASGPDTDTWAIQRLLFNAIANARSSIRLTTPYFVPDEALLAALVAAALRGVSVRVLVPKASDSKVVTAAARSYFEELSQVGVEIWEYGPPMLHAKTSVFDDIVSVVGTANLDNRSFRLNFEVVAVLYSPEAAQELNAQFDRDLGDATRHVPAGRRAPLGERLLMGAARLFSPIL